MLLPSVVLILSIATFLCSLARFSIINFSRTRLDEICREHKKESRFGEILKLQDELWQAVELALSTSATILFAVAIFWLQLAQWPAATFLDWASYLTEIIALLATLACLMVILPWPLSRVTGEKFLFHYWPLLYGIIWLSRPILALISRLDTIFHRLWDLEEPNNGENNAVLTELRTVVEEGQREGIFESEARTMIHRVIELQDDDVGAIMTPRTAMVCIQADSTLEEAREKLLGAGHSRIPVIRESPDNMVGILYAKDLLRYMRSTENGEPPPSLVEIVRPPFYVPETTPIDALLETLKRERVHVAIVLDEYGGVAGLVTLEDILEEIVGEIVDEYDAAEEEPIRDVQEGVIEVDARVHVDDVNEKLDIELPEGDYDTIAGFVITQFGRVPAVGESTLWESYRFTVIQADERKIEKLLIEEVDSQQVEKEMERV